MGDVIIQVKDVSFVYNQAASPAIKDINFSVEQGSFFCIIGANASGKSTLCNALAGLIPHYFLGEMSGEIMIDGVPLMQQTAAQRSRSIGLVSQNPFNQLSYTAATVAEELAYGLGNRGVSRTEMLEKVDAVAKLMRLDHLLSKNPLELSGGQIQRVAFGSAFILEPKILVLDECTTQLDPLGAEEIFELIKNLNNQGITAIVTDHDMERVARYADKVLVLDAGKVVHVGLPQQVFSNPALEQYHIAPPDYMEIYHEFKKRDYTNSGFVMTEPAAVQMVKEALKT